MKGRTNVNDNEAYLVDSDATSWLLPPRVLLGHLSRLSTGDGVVADEGGNEE